MRGVWKRRCCGLAASVLLGAAGPAAAQTYFTHLGAGGVAPPPPNAVFADATGLPGVQNADVFITGAFPPPDLTNLGNARSHDNNGLQAIGGVTTLGLLAGDVVDAIQVERVALSNVNVVLAPAFFFSVKPGAAGLAGSAVALEGPANGADVFESAIGGFSATPGTNAKSMNEVELGLAGGDDLNGLDVQNQGPPTPNTAPVYFSLAPGSPSLALIADPFGGTTPFATPGDILCVVPGGAPFLLFNHENLGLDGDDDVDALAFVEGLDANGDGDFLDPGEYPPFFYFSVTSTSSGNPGTPVRTEFLAGEVGGDVFMAAPLLVFDTSFGVTYPMPAGAPTSPVTLAADEAVIGLAPADELDALDVKQIEEPSTLTYYPGPFRGIYGPPPPFRFPPPPPPPPWPPPPGGPPGQAACSGGANCHFFGQVCFKTFCFRFSIVNKQTTRVVASFTIRGVVIGLGCDDRTARAMNNALAAFFAGFVLPGGNRFIVSRGQNGQVRLTVAPGAMVGPNHWLVFNGWTNGFSGCAWECLNFGGDGVRLNNIKINGIDNIDWRLVGSLRIPEPNRPLDPSVPFFAQGRMQLRLPQNPVNIQQLNIDPPQGPVPQPPEPGFFDVFVTVDLNETPQSLTQKLMQAIPAQAPGYEVRPGHGVVDIYNTNVQPGTEVPPFAMKLANSSSMMMAMEFTGFPDANLNSRDDLEDIFEGVSRDLDGNNVPDEAEPGGSSYLMVCDVAARRVLLLDRHDGTLLHPAFIAGRAAGMRRPIEALQIGDRVWVSDQTTDSIYLFDLDGRHVSTITGRLDEVRGLERGFHPVHGEVVYATNAGAANGAPEDSVVLFATDGTRLGDFPAGTNPWDVLNYNGELLITDINVEDIMRFDHAGRFLGLFHDSCKPCPNSIDFPGQLSIKPGNGHVLAAGFSPPSGFFEYDPAGTQVGHVFIGPPGVRGVHELGNGNVLYTDDSGVHVYDTAGMTRRTVVAGSARFATPVTLPRPVCYADCDHSRALDIFDFLCFQNAFAAEEPYACDCDLSTGTGLCDIFDFLCYQNLYAAGCDPRLLDARFSQADLAFDSPPVPDSDWASVDIEFVGSRELMYFNLQHEGRWVVQNAPVVSTEGPGAVQTKTLNFPTGRPPGTRLGSFFDITYDLDFAPRQEPPPRSTREVPVADRPVTIRTGERETTLAATPARGIQAAPAATTAAFNTGVPNQDCQLNGCVPAAMSNSLKYLKATHNLNIPDPDISLENMKNVTGWGPGGANWPDWWTMKQTWANARGITTTTTQDPAVAAAALARNCDVEMRVPGHVAAVTGMVKLASGKWGVWVKHDTDQGNAGGTKEELVIYNPMDGTCWDGFGFDGRGPATFVIECPS